MPNRIACRKVAGQLPDYAAGRLPAALREPLAQHLESCAACQRELEDYRSTVQLMVEAGQSALPSSRTDWQMLAARMDAERTARPASALPIIASLRLALSLAGARLIIIGFKMAWGRRPDHAINKTSMTKASTPPGSQQQAMDSSSLASQPGKQFPPSAKQRQGGDFPLVPHLRTWPATDNAWARSPRSDGKRNGDSLSPAQVQQLLAEAARKIDAIENAPPSQDERKALADLFARQQLSAETPASVQITVLAKDRTLLDNRIAFMPTGNSGGAWIRQTLLEQPDGERTTETVAAVVRSDSPDSSDSFFNLQTCVLANRHQHGEIQP